eukprot:Colp12_sorted_trinity150504_noHs@27928
MMHSVRDRVEGFYGGQEVARDELGALMDELVESVLAVGARLAPNDRASLVVHLLPSASHKLAVGLHITLLEVGRKTRHVLVVGKDGGGLCTEEIVVEDADKSEKDRDVLLKWCSGEVVVDVVSTSKKLLKVIHADAASDGEADGAPERVATANPVPESEHVHGVDAELHTLGLVGGERNKVLGNSCRVLSRLKEPCLGRGGVCDGLLGSESLGGNDEQSSLGVELAENLGKVGTIDIAHKVNIQVTLRERLESLRDHDWSEIRTADTNVNDVSNGLAGVSLPGARANSLSECSHLGENSIHVGHDVLAIDKDGTVGTVAESYVKDSAALSEIDLLTSKHLITPFLKTSLTGKIQEELKSLLCHYVLGEIDKELAIRSVERSAKLLKAVGIRSEKVAHRSILQNAVKVRLKRSVGGALREFSHLGVELSQKKNRLQRTNLQTN